MKIHLEFSVSSNPQMTYCVWGVAELQEDVNPTVPTSVRIPPGGLFGMERLTMKEDRLRCAHE